MTDFKEGQTATHPDGRQVVYKSGNWVSVPGKAAPVKITKEAEKELAGIRATVRKIDINEAEMAEFDQLNDRIRPSGGFVDNAYQKGRSLLGNPDIARMEQLQAKMAANARVVGSGATSDFDARQLIKMTGGAYMPYRTNQAYSKLSRKVYANTRQTADLYEKYAAAHGNLVGVSGALETLRKKRPPTPSKDGWAIEDAD